MTTLPEIVGYLDERDKDVMPCDLAEHLQGEKGFPFKTPLIRLADYEALAELLAELLEASEAIIAISDRKHDAWDAAEAAIAKVKEVQS